jgi:hypothetical protein
MKPINLNRIRKERTRADEKKHADENAVKFGRTKAQRLLETAQNEQARAHLDRHAFEDE